MQKQLYAVINDMWRFLKTYTAGTPSEDRRLEAFREINDLMARHGIKKGSPLGDFTYEILEASFDLVDALCKQEGRSSGSNSADPG